MSEIYSTHGSKNASKILFWIPEEKYRKQRLCMKYRITLPSGGITLAKPAKGKTTMNKNPVEKMRLGQLKTYETWCSVCIINDH